MEKLVKFINHELGTVSDAEVLETKDGRLFLFEDGTYCYECNIVVDYTVKDVD